REHLVLPLVPPLPHQRQEGARRDMNGNMCRYFCKNPVRRGQDGVDAAHNRAPVDAVLMHRHSHTGLVVADDDAVSFPDVRDEGKRPGGEAWAVPARAHTRTVPDLFAFPERMPPPGPRFRKIQKLLLRGRRKSFRNDDYSGNHSITAGAQYLSWERTSFI